MYAFLHHCSKSTIDQRDFKGLVHSNHTLEKYSTEVTQKPPHPSTPSPKILHWVLLQPECLNALQFVYNLNIFLMVNVADFEPPVQTVLSYSIQRLGSVCTVRGARGGGVLFLIWVN